MFDAYLIVPALSLLLNLGLSVVMWVRRPGEEAGKALETFRQQVVQMLAEHRQAVDATLQLQAGRLTEIETHMEHMPSSTELLELKATVMQIAERTTGLSENMMGMRQSLSRIETYLLNNSKPS